MELLRREDIKLLAEVDGGPCVSIYCPTFRGGAEARQGPIRLKNQLREVEQQLATAGLEAGEARRLLEPAQKLIDDYDFWQHQSEGLAIFLCKDVFRCYKVPLNVQELVVVTDHLHIKPLLQLFMDDGHYYVLALSQKAVRLLLCTKHGAREVGLPEKMPKTLQDALQEEEPELQLQFHTRTQPRAGVDRGAVFFGSGAETDNLNEKLHAWFRMIDKHLKEIFREEKAPLVLAGVEYLLPIYRDANTYPHITETGVTGNPEGMKPEELQKKAWPVVEPLFRKAVEDAAERYHAIHGTEKDRTSTHLQDVLAAALDRRIEFLFVPAGVELWGRLDREKRRVDLHKEQKPGDEDLLNVAALETLLNGGTVYAVEPGKVPRGKDVAAVLRW